MSINDFLTKGNVDLLWEVIIDDELFKNKPKELINQIGNMFAQNLRGFNESEKNNSNNLINMNKKFIELMLNRSYTTSKRKRKRKRVNHFYGFAFR